jgi:hypothetical protein
VIGQVGPPAAGHSLHAAQQAVVVVVWSLVRLSRWSKLRVCSSWCCWISKYREFGHFIVVSLRLVVTVSIQYVNMLSMG